MVESVVEDPRAKEYEHFAHGRNPLQRLAEQFAPNIVGLAQAKKALILSLVSVDDEGSNRGRVHVMFHGLPGGAKTSLVGWAAGVAGSELWSPRLSEGGLTIDFRNQKIGILGKMHDSEFQLLALDEIDKLGREELGQLLMAMEKGFFTYAGGGESGRIPAHVRVLATCNDLDAIPDEVRDRFDYRIRIDPPRRVEAAQVVEGIADSFMRSGVKKTEELGFIQGYLRWCRGWRPEFSDEERVHASRIFRILVDGEPTDQVRLRPYEAVLRSAYALARIEHGHVTAERVMDAVELLHPGRDFSGKFGALRELLRYLRERGMRQRRYKTKPNP